MSLLVDAIQARSDDRGFCRTTLAELATDTALSTRTVQRLLCEFEADGRLQRRSVRGHSGGLLLRLVNTTAKHDKHDTKHDKHDTERDAFTRGTGPEGALSPPLREAKHDTNTTARRDPAYRPIASHETPLSGAKLLYTGDDIDAKWRRISATFWEAPNGDTVSIRSMTPELRLRLRVDLNDDGTECIEAVKAVRGMLSS